MKYGTSLGMIERGTSIERAEDEGQKNDSGDRLKTESPANLAGIVQFRSFIVAQFFPLLHHIF